jgi:hypothetical protein
VAGEKLKTTIEIGVDDRQVRGLGRTLDGALNPRTVDRFTRSIDRATAAIEKMAKLQAGLVGHLEEAAKIQSEMARSMEMAQRRQQQQMPGGALAPTPGQRSPADERERDEHRRELAAQRYQRWENRVNSAGAAVVPQEGMIARALGGLPWVGGLLGGAASAATQFSSHSDAYSRALAQTAGVLGTSRGFNTRMPGEERSAVGAYQRAGFSATEMLPMLRELAQAGWISGDNVLGVAPTAARLQAGLGVGAGQAGSLISAIGTARMDEPNPQESIAILTDAVDSGIRSGFSRSVIGQYMQQMASDIEGLRRQGIMIDPHGMLAMQRFVANLGQGFAGAAGPQAAQGMRDALRGAPDRSGAFSAFAMQAAGFGRGRSAFQAARTLEESPWEVLPTILQQMNARGGSEESRAMAIRQLFMDGGHTLSRTQALTLAQIAPEDIQRRIDDANRRGGLSDIEQLLEPGERGSGGAAVIAGEENQRIAVGQRVRPIVTQMRGLELQYAREFAEIGVNVFNAVREGLREAADAAVSGGARGLMRHLASTVAPSGSTARASADQWEAGREDINRSFDEAMAPVIGSLQDFDSALSTVINRISRFFGGGSEAPAPAALSAGTRE